MAVENFSFMENIGEDPVSLPAELFCYIALIWATTLYYKETDLLWLWYGLAIDSNGGQQWII